MARCFGVLNLDLQIWRQGQATLDLPFHYGFYLESTGLTAEYRHWIRSWPWCCDLTSWLYIRSASSLWTYLVIWNISWAWLPQQISSALLVWVLWDLTFASKAIVCALLFRGLPYREAHSCFSLNTAPGKKVLQLLTSKSLQDRLEQSDTENLIQNC